MPRSSAWCNRTRLVSFHSLCLRLQATPAALSVWAFLASFTQLPAVPYRLWMGLMAFPIYVLGTLATNAGPTLKQTGFTWQSFEVEEVRELAGAILVLVWLSVNVDWPAMLGVVEREATDKRTVQTGLRWSLLLDAATVAIPLAAFGAWYLWRQQIASGAVHVAEHCQGMLG